MSSVMKRLVWVAVIAIVTSAANAERLRRDPFEPPTDLDTLTARPDALTRSAGTDKPVIRGILFAGTESLVNLSGEIIGPGEEASGYTLLEVAVDHAIFRRGDEIVTLSLDPDEESDDEPKQR